MVAAISPILVVDIALLATIFRAMTWRSPLATKTASDTSGAAPFTTNTSKGLEFQGRARGLRTNRRGSSCRSKSGPFWGRSWPGDFVEGEHFVVLSGQFANDRC